MADDDPAVNEAPLPADLIDPHPERLAPGARHYAEILARHRAAIDAGRRLYEDPATGLWVMTAAALWPRPCCDNGCRHCPHLPRR